MDLLWIELGRHSGISLASARTGGHPTSGRQVVLKGEEPGGGGATSVLRWRGGTRWLAGTALLRRAIVGLFDRTDRLRSRGATEHVEALQTDALGQSDSNGVQPKFGHWLLHLHNCEFPDLCRVRWFTLVRNQILDSF